MAKKSPKTAPTTQVDATKKKPTRGHTGKPRGRPRVRIIGPAELEEIAHLYLRGQSTYAIAEKFGVSRENIQNHIDRHLRPLWKERANKTVDDLRAEIQEIKEENWLRYQESKAESLADARWALEQEAKLGGHYAPEKHQHDVGGAFRAAGVTPEDALYGFLAKVKVAAEKEKEQK